MDIIEEELDTLDKNDKKIYLRLYDLLQRAEALIPSKFGITKIIIQENRTKIRELLDNLIMGKEVSEDEIHEFEKVLNDY